MAAQLVKKVVYVDMKALEEEAAVSCWRPVGARTDRKLGLIRECAWWLVALATDHPPVSAIHGWIDSLRNETKIGR